jgi:cytosine/adenosine deaminase-related metal-dependent hydrolase
MKKNFILINCNIRNPKSDCGLIKDAAIMVNNQDGISKIRYIGSCDSIPVSDDYNTVDLKGKYVFPGLINAHCHLFGNGKPIKSISNEFGKNLLVKVLNFPLTKVMLLKTMKRNVVTELSSGVTTIRTLGNFHNLDIKIKNDIAIRLYKNELLLKGILEVIILDNNKKTIKSVILSSLICLFPIK